MIRSSWLFVHREILRFFRQRGRLVATLLTPLLFWAFLGLGFGSLFEQTQLQKSSATYFFPGVLMLTVVFSSVFSMISLIQDRNEGFLQGMRLIPQSALKIVLGKISASSVMAMVQSVLILLLFPLAGIQVKGTDFVSVFLILGLASVLMSLIGFGFAWYLNSVQGFHGIMNMVIFPMWILSGAIFPFETAHTAIQFLMRLNPLRVMVDAMRVAFEKPSGALTPFSGDMIGWTFITLLLIGLMSLCVYLVSHAGTKSRD